MWYTLACLFSHSIEKLISTKLNSELNMKRKTRKLSTSLCSSFPHWYYDVFPSKSISQQKVLLFLFSPPPTYAFQFDDDSYMLFSPYTKVIKLTYRMLVGSLVYSSYYCWLTKLKLKNIIFFKEFKNHFIYAFVAFISYSSYDRWGRALEPSISLHIKDE